MLKKITIGILILSLLAISSIAVEQYQDKTCTLSQLAPGHPLWICVNPDGGMDHSFLTFSAMHQYYTPGLEEINNPPKQYLYVVGGTTGTYTLSGKK